MAGAPDAAAHVAVVEAEEVEALASFAQVHDPRLGLLGLKPELGEKRPERRQGAPGPPSHVLHITTRSSA